MFGGPYFGFYESIMVGEGAYFCNAPPLNKVACSRLFVIMGFNYERGVGEMLEDLGHRAESILTHVFGGWESASRGAGVTMQTVAERLGITDVFLGVDELTLEADGSFEVLERIEGGKHQSSRCAGLPAVLGWATGSLPEPKNNPQVGMMNMRAVMPALQKAKPATIGAEGVTFTSVTLPKQLRETRIVKDASADDIAKEIVEWIRE